MQEELIFQTGLLCRYLLQTPDSPPANPLIVLALHGYGQNAAAMLKLTGALFGDSVVIASLQAPNQFYLSSTTPDSAIGYNWGTREHWASSVQLHHKMILQVLQDMELRFDTRTDRILLLGFSQPVGLNYRFAGTYPNRVGGVIGICGGVPKDWEEDKYESFSTPLLHIAREEDEFFQAKTAEGFPARLRRHASDVEFHMLPGGHRFPSKAGHVVEPWLKRVFGSQPGFGDS